MVEASRGEGTTLSPRRPQACKCGKQPMMRVQNLETKCPTDWSPMKKELDDFFATIASSVDRAGHDLYPSEVGG